MTTADNSDDTTDPTRGVSSGRPGVFLKRFKQTAGGPGAGSPKARRTKLAVSDSPRCRAEVSRRERGPRCGRHQRSGGGGGVSGVERKRPDGGRAGGVEPVKGARWGGVGDSAVRVDWGNRFLGVE